MQKKAGKGASMKKREQARVFKCPQCGGDGYYQSRHASWVLAGKIRQQITVGCAIHRAPVFDQGLPVLTAPEITLIKDVCEQCGAEFVREIWEGEVAVGQQIARGKRG